jgi:dehydrogenase/reductase SDR family member 1
MLLLLPEILAAMVSQVGEKSLEICPDRFYVRFFYLGFAGRLEMKNLSDKIALVTGGSYGVGKGIAMELFEAGATVYVTGRSLEDQQVKGLGNTFKCDHCDDERVRSVFRRIADRHDHLDILVNNAWGGYENMIEGGEFTWTRPFWQQPLWRWDAMFQAGVRAAYVASQLAVQSMVSRSSGLIINISFWAAQKYMSNVAYGVAKAAMDKMTADMSQELREHGVAVLSLYPGLVRTEKVMASAAWLDLGNSESPQFVGRAVAALAADPKVMEKTGSIAIAAQLARDYGFNDIDGKSPRPLTLADV